MNKPSYIIYRADYGSKNDWSVIRRDTIEDGSTRIGRFTTRNEATKVARLLAGRQGRVAFTHDVTTYPW